MIRRTWAVAGGMAAVVTLSIMAVLAVGSPTSAPVTSRPATAPTEKEFLAVMQARCVRCHPNSRTVAQIEKLNWIKPGNPEASRLYTCLNNAKKKGGTYHDVTPAQKTLIYNFIKAKGPATRPASQPATRPAPARR